MSLPDQPATVLRLSGDKARKPLPFDLVPDQAGTAALAQRLDLLALRKLRFRGVLTPEGRQDWRLEGALGATVVQPCGLTLAPVTTRIDEVVTRRYLADLPAPAPGETEMPADDTAEPLPVALDLAEVMAEALSLALPPFPRAEGAAFAGPEEEVEPPESPFAVLRKLQGDLP